jgi:hypothetical protein
MDDFEYITKDALMMCDQGGTPDFFKPAYNTSVKINGCLVATNMDALPLANIPSFKVCKITRGPCIPGTFPMTWQDTWQVKIKNVNSLIGKSTCHCLVGGKVEFLTSGQIPLPEEAAAELKTLQAHAQKQLDDTGNGNSVGEAGLAEGFIPVWGSGRDLINDIQTGDAKGIAINAAFLVWDVTSIVAGLFSLGAGAGIMQGAKNGLKGALKTGAKLISKDALKQLGKTALRKLSKEALKESVDNLAKKLVRMCVFACFPAGTPVQTVSGLKNIEDIQAGDQVWSYNEETGEIGLQVVIDVMVRESDHTLKLYTDIEVIETTAQHPFYTRTGWKNASELDENTKIRSKSGEEIRIKKVQFLYEPKKVYTFEVAQWHTYFVGNLAWLVHNAQRCLAQMMLESQRWFQNIMRGNSFNHVMNAFTEEIAHGAGKIFRSELGVVLKNGKTGFVDSFIKGVAVIERKATNLAKVSSQTAKAYINDAAKYAKSTSKEFGQLSEKVYLQVQNMKGVSQEVMEYAEKKGVQIIDDISQIKGL